MRSMKKLFAQQYEKKKQRVRLKTQIALGYFTGRTIALLIVCVLIGWFLYLQFADAETIGDCPLNAASGKLEKKGTLLTACQHRPTMGLVVME